MTALRSCAACSASGNVPTVVAKAMGVSPFLRCAEPGLSPPSFLATILRRIGYGYSEAGAAGGPVSQYGGRRRGGASLRSADKPFLGRRELTISWVCSTP